MKAIDELFSKYAYIVEDLDMLTRQGKSIAILVKQEGTKPGNA